MQERSSRRRSFCEIGKIEARYIRGRPNRQLGVAVFPNDEGVDVARIDPKLSAEQVFEPGSVEHGTRSDHPVCRETGKPQGDLGEDIDRVGHHQEDRVGIMTDKFRNDLAENFRIFRTRSMRVSPGAWFAPAAKMIIPQSARSG